MAKQQTAVQQYKQQFGGVGAAAAASLSGAGAAVGGPPAYQANVPQPLGVPADYRAPLQDTGTTDVNAAELAAQAQGLTNAPRYYAGMQWGTVPDFPTDVAGITRLQQMLMQSGYLNPKQTIVGQWDATSATAFAQVLASANQAGVDWTTALARSLSAADQTNALQAATKRPEVTTLTNPEDIRAAAQSAARSLYGGDLTPQEEAQFVASYQGMQAASHHAAYQAGDVTATGDYSGAPIAGGTVTATPSLGVAAADAIKQAHPDQVFVSSLGKMLGEVFGQTAQSGAVGGGSPYASGAVTG